MCAGHVAAMEAAAAAAAAAAPGLAEVDFGSGSSLLEPSFIAVAAPACSCRCVPAGPARRSAAAAAGGGGLPTGLPNGSHKGDGQRHTARPRQPTTCHAHSGPRASIQQTFAHCAALQDSEGVLERVAGLVRLFGLATECGQERLAAALASSCLPAAALAAAKHLQRARHPQAGDQVSRWQSGSPLLSWLILLP